MMRNRHGDRGGSKRGFTLIELLVVIAIVSLLIGLLLPALGGARRAGRQAQSLVNVRTTSISFDQYTNDNRVYPFRGMGQRLEGTDLFEDVPDDVLAVQWWPGSAIIAATDHFSHAYLWPAILTPLDEWPEFYPTWVSPGFDNQLPDVERFIESDIAPEDLVSIRYSNSFVASPRLWPVNPDSPPVSDRAMIRAVAPHEVRSPAGKVMLWDGHLAYQNPEPERVAGHYDELTPMAFADGHGEVLNPLDATPPAINGLRSSRDGLRAIALHDTPGGVAGIDY